MLELISHSPEETQGIGEHIGRLARRGDVFLLTGNLGAGKTCLTQGIARGLDIREHALSPSFVIIREMKGRLPLYHIDLYRLERLEEVADLGLDDYLYGAGVCVIEWADRGLRLMPEENLRIELSYLSETGRRLAFKPSGPRYAEVVALLAAAYSEPEGTG